MKPLRFLRYGKVYILPTYNGMVVVGLTMLAIICATSSGNNLLYLLSILFGLMTLITMLQAHHNLKGLKVESMKPVLSSAGEVVDAQFTVSLKDQMTRQNIQVQIPNFEFFKIQKYLPTGKTIDQPMQNIHMQFKPRPRGQYLINRVKLTSSFPYGLWRVWMWSQLESEAIIYPRPEGDLTLPFYAPNALPGESPSVDGGDDFSDLKKYVSGENPNHIDWRSFARGRGLHTKKFSSGGSVCATLDINIILEPNLERKLGQMSQWLQQCEKENLPFHFRTETLQISHESPELMDSKLRRCWLHLASFCEEDESAK